MSAVGPGCVDSLIELDGNGCYTLGCADDIAILICGKFVNTVSELVQEALSIVQQWCDRTQLSINPQKMVIVQFTQKGDLRGLKEPVFSGHILQLTTMVRYLGLILDVGLKWKAQLKNVTNKAYRAFWTRVVHWIYTMVIRPLLTNRSMIWWWRVRCSVSRGELSKLQRLACLAITGAMAMTLTAAVEVLLGLLFFM
jgi:hypothetical protein